MKTSQRLVTGLLLSAVATPLAATSSSTAPAADDRKSDPVWCLDEKRAIVKRTARWRCKGKIVSHEEAQRVKQERINRIKRVLKREKEPILPGKRLSGTGTGFFISTEGDVLTNNHVIDKCRAITVSPAGGSEVVAQVIGANPQHDLALLRTGTSSPDAAKLREFDEVIPNEPVTIVGYPLHGKVVIKPVLVSGHVRDGAQPKNPDVFAMKADIRRGNSGGPVLDQASRVMGVVFAKINTPKVYEKTGKLIRDVGLAIRLPAVRNFLRQHSVAFATTGENTAQELNARLVRAREFIAQIGCWR